LACIGRLIGGIVHVHRTANFISCRVSSGFNWGQPAFARRGSSDRAPEMAPEGVMGLFFYRLMGAAMLDESMYEGIEADRSITGQAAVAVVLSSLAAGIGASGLYGVGLTTFVVFTLLALLTWIAWATLMFQIGTRILPEPQTDATLGELLRTIGFAAAPGLLQVFAIFPWVAVPVFVTSWLWMFAAMVIGVQHALDYQHTWRALAVCALAASLSVALAITFGLLFGPVLY
jgi:hypothetical protein